ISAHEAVDYANSRGVDVIVTDHHDLGETLPNAKAIVNPKLLSKDHLLANLAGVGVAYKLAEALIALTPHPSPAGRGMSEGQGEGELLDLVALGLIADVALLKGETRSLAQKGIQKLRETKRLGLKVIAELSGTNLETLTEETIGFTFAPRLNALGRLSDANPAVELLLTQDPARARLLAAQIEGLNAQRRLLTSQVYEAAEAQLRENPSLLTEPAIILSHRDWPGGVVGIVANRLVERYHKPALLLTESEGGALRGSARSIEGLHITEAIASQKDILLNFGGHPMAAGLSLEANRLNEFRKGLGKAIEKQLGAVVLEEPSLQIDAWLGFNEIDFELANALESLSPFGAGNPELTLASHNLTLKSVKEIGKTKEHLRLNIEDENGNTQSILWWNGAGEELPDAESKIDAAYSLRAGTYRGQKQLTLQFKEFRVVEERPIELRHHKLEVIDLRLQVGKFQGLMVEIFAEGEHKKKANGNDRYSISRSDELAIYTIPPGPHELQAVIEKVKPKKIYVMGIAPTEEKTDEFLSRLAGMAKFAINQRNGKASIQELAAATAQREAAIRVGLEWLGAGGHVRVRNEADEITLSAGDGESNPYLQKELYIAVKGLLAETAAYRAHFARTDAESLFKF
ncbi:MAG: single-stranded-DNA-specific exonuclease RecJ, partial [Chloroflexi bacterium]|nr:single-stranded-DNA-specific exonuclease RecJ [Chloroflexota bacterium]